MPQHPFTERSHAAPQRAQDAARDFRHEYVGTEHLLLGVLAADGSGEVQSLLRSHGPAA
jgi:hypothetical protein